MWGEKLADKFNPSSASATDVLRILRHQRHGYLNYLQVIYGYLQLKKPDQALRYIKEVIKEIEGEGSLFSLAWPELVLQCFWWSIIASQERISLSWEVATDLSELGAEVGEVLEVLNFVWDRVMELLLNVDADKRSLGVEFREIPGRYAVTFELPPLKLDPAWLAWTGSLPGQHNFGILVKHEGETLSGLAVWLPREM